MVLFPFRLTATVWILALVMLTAGCGTDVNKPSGSPSTRYGDLLSLFAEWREFQRPKIMDGVPDYSDASMTAQQQGLSGYRRRLADIDPKAWPVPQQVDYYVVRAEMNGLDFDHRVLRPWANNPAFYVTVFWNESDQPAREGPFAYG